MQKKRLLLLSLVTVLIATAVVLWIVEIKSSLPDTPVTIRYLGPNDLEVGSEKGQRVLSFAPDRRLKLWVTNHTQKILVIDITQVEIRVGTVWTKDPLADGHVDLRFLEGPWGYTRLLNPHAATRGFLQKFPLPKTNLWRLRVSVSEKLVGASYFFAGIKESLSALFFDHRLQNPFPRGLIYHGKSREVMSEEIYVNPTDHPLEPLF